jgi:hypothetical protein
MEIRVLEGKLYKVELVTDADNLLQAQHDTIDQLNQELIKANEDIAALNKAVADSKK